MKQLPKSRKNVAYYVDGILNGERVVLAQAITIMESNLPADQEIASAIMEKVIQKSGNSMRIGITGAPGVGKSTFIESFGKFLTDLGKKVAVLTIDPSSQRSKGSILGDKTRMPDLATNPNAFIRPSSSGATLGGVARKTREAILLCEAAGFDVVLIETVGVGQSEMTVKNMTDFFLLLMLPGSGDELQGIKKGIMEMADLVLITKADGENLARAKNAQAEFLHAINTLYSHSSNRVPKVLTSSAAKGTGMREVYEVIEDFMTSMRNSGELTQVRRQQNIEHMHENFYHMLTDEIRQSPQMKAELERLEDAVEKQSISPNEAARQLLHRFRTNH